MKKIAYLFIMALLMSNLLFANNLSISNTSLTLQDTGSDYVMVQFDLSWDNSWRTDNLNGDGVENWDAAWLFIKYKTLADGVWHHATINTTASNHNTGTQSTNATINSPSDGVGAFYHRSANGTGTFSSTSVQLRWEYGTNGIGDDIESEVSAVKVFGIEMVYVPQGSFYIGSGGTESNAFYKYPTTTNAYQVTSEDAINTGQTTDYLWAGAYIEAGTIPSSFPKGYNAFYSMKYEITQEQYVDFLNTLTRTQQNTRTGTDISGTSITNRYVMSNSSSMQYRNGIRCDATLHATDPVTFYCDFNGNGTGNESYDGQNIACNWLSWVDGASYGDWSGLRPMTELEFEKACRGTAAAVANEYAWGTTNIAGSAYTLTNAGADNEEIATNYSTTAGNASYFTTISPINGPLRVGIFASNSSNSGRETSGASYYGIMELSGNLWERPVIISNVTGRSFTGINGDGSLDVLGNADVSNWPGTDALGSGFRGSDERDSNIGYLRVSDRTFTNTTENGRHIYGYGFRCVR